MNAEQEAKLERAEMRMVRWMFGVSLREKKTNAELRESMGIEKISDVMRCSRLGWMGHVLRKEGNNWVNKSMEMIVEGSRGRWSEMEGSIMGSKRLTPTRVGKMTSKCLL